VRWRRGGGRCAQTAAWQFGDFRVTPGTANGILLRGSGNQWAAQKHLREKAAQANHRIDGGGHERGGECVDLRHHDDMQVLRFLSNVGAPFHQHGGVDALHLQVVGGGHAALDAHVAAHKVKRETLAEEIAEIERKPARQRLEAEHAEQLGQAWLRFEKLASAHVEMDLAGHGAVVGADGRAQPSHLPLHAPAPTPHHFLHAHARQQLAGISHVQRKIEHRAALHCGTCQRTAPCRAGAADLCPVAIGGQRCLGGREIELVQAPFARCVGGAAVARIDFQAPQFAPAQLKGLHHDVKRRQAGRLLGQQIVHLAHRAFRQ